MSPHKPSSRQISERATPEQGWMALVATMEQLAAAGSLAEIIAIIRSRARAISGADGVCVILREGKDCHYVDEDAIAPLWKGQRFAMNICAAGWCLTHNETAVIRDVFQDPRVDAEVYRATFIKAMVLVPLRNPEPVGAIGFYWAKTRSFVPPELALIEALGRLASAALQAHDKYAVRLRPLLTAARLNDLEAMASSLAHELNQPLAAGTNYLKAAERLLAKDPGQARNALDKAGGQLVRTNELIHRIRGRVGQGHSEATREALEPLCCEVLDLVRATCDGPDIALTLKSGLPMITLDKVAIEQLLFNLIRNAVEAVAGQAVQQVSLSVAQDGADIVFRVSDNGPGLAPEIAEHVFMPFHSTKAGGMGVGLSHCRKIADSQGGKLWHEPGEHGAAFCLRLPVAPERVV